MGPVKGRPRKVTVTFVVSYHVRGACVTTSTWRNSVTWAGESSLCAESSTPAAGHPPYGGGNAGRVAGCVLGARPLGETSSVLVASSDSGAGRVWRFRWSTRSSISHSCGGRCLMDDFSLPPSLVAFIPTL